MEKIVLLCEPITSENGQEIFFDNIREKLDKIKENTFVIWEKVSKQSSFYDHNSTKSIHLTGSIPNPQIKSKTYNEKNPVLAIISSKENSNIIAGVFDSEREFQVETKNWLQSNNIEFLLEIIINDSFSEKWTFSINFFSAKVLINLNELESLINDLYLELLFKEFFLNNKFYKDVLFPTKNYNLSEHKFNFLIELKYIILSNRIKFYPFSKLARQKNGSYNYQYLLNIWLKFLVKTAVKKNIYINPPLSLIPEFKSLHEVFSLLPSKRRKNVHKMISDNIKYGDLLLIYLKKSIIGQNESTKLHIKNLFKNDTKIGTIRILPYSDLKSLDSLRHLLFVVPFKINKL